MSNQRDVRASSGSVAAGGNVTADELNVDNRKYDQRMNLMLQMVMAAADPSPPPRADSNDLSDCPHCGRRWLSKLALFCPTCGYSVQFARLNERRVGDMRWLAPLMTLILAAYTATLVFDRGGIPIANPLGPEAFFVALMGSSACVFLVITVAAWWPWLEQRWEKGK